MRRFFLLAISSEQLVLEAFNMFLRVDSPVHGNVTSIQFYNHPGRYIYYLPLYRKIFTTYLVSKLTLMPL
jgi:hypothetical protein